MNMNLFNRRQFLQSASAGVIGAVSGLSISDFALAEAQKKEPIAVDLSAPSDVTDAEMQAIYDEIKTPYKYGVVLPQEEGDAVDSPNIYRIDGVWHMIYLRFYKGTGYIARIAKSDDLLHWESLGTVAPFREKGWDAWQCSPSAALVDHVWGGSYDLQKYDGKYWFTYIGGAGKGYEPDPLKIGLAHTDAPTTAKEWTRLDDPIMTPEDPDARAFEQTTMYKTSVIWDHDETLGYPFVCFYNGKSVATGNSIRAHRNGGLEGPSRMAPLRNRSDYRQRFGNLRGSAGRQDRQPLGYVLLRRVLEATGVRNVRRLARP